MNTAALPAALQSALSELAETSSQEALIRDAQTISERYRLKTGQGDRLVTRSGEAAAYALSRMPATFAAASSALTRTLECCRLEPRTLLDCGAGTGAVSWAARSLLPLDSVICLERESAMRALGQHLCGMGDAALQAADWRIWDAMSPEALPKAELVFEGYMLGELPPEARLPAARRLWDAAEQLLLFVEPGTPQGFANLRAVRKELTEKGAFVCAPCPANAISCDLPENDWCHFTVRVPRTRIHRALKGGEVPYEDEKFCYLALSKTPQDPCAARVLRHPQIAPGRIDVTLCENGNASVQTITKKDPLWKRARKISAGEAL